LKLKGMLGDRKKEELEWEIVLLEAEDRWRKRGKEYVEHR
jgi:hypothetical protein